MKNLKDFITELNKLDENVVLVEAQDYAGIFNPLWTFIDKQIKPELEINDENLVTLNKRINELKKSADDYINDAKKVLHKNDRIVWFLKLVRLRTLDELQNILSISYKHGKAYDNLNKYIEKEQVAFSPPIDYRLQGLNLILSNLEHSLSLPIAEIKNTVFTNQDPYALIENFQDLEKDWSEQQKQILNYSAEEEITFTTLIKFPDGKVWINLNKPYCEIEGKSMGHCGNRAAYKEDDTVLSLREPIKHGGEIKWRSCLTFILHADGNLGEMKGRGNQKPAPQYHDYIIELLKLPLIKGIVGGGYAPERNFALSDLPQEEQDALVEMKSSLGTMLYQYDRFGMTKELAKRCIDKVRSMNIKNANLYIEYAADKKQFIVNEWSLADFIKHYAPDVRHGNNSLQYAYDICIGNEDLDTFNWVQKSDIEDFVRELPKDLEKGLIEYCAQNYPTAFNSDGTFEEDAYDLLTENDDEILSMFSMAVEAGYRSGTQQKIYDGLLECLKDWDANGFHLELGKHMFEDDVKIVINEKDFVLNLSNDGFCERIESDGDWFTRDDGPNLEQPRYGWSDFDREAALEYLKENGDIDLLKLAKEAKKEAKEAIEFFKKKL